MPSRLWLLYKIYIFRTTLVFLFDMASDQRSQLLSGMVAFCPPLLLFLEAPLQRKIAQTLMLVGITRNFVNLEKEGNPVESLEIPPILRTEALQDGFRCCKFCCRHKSDLSICSFCLLASMALFLIPRCSFNDAASYTTLQLQ